MTMCEAVSDRMRAVAAGHSEWTAEERAHLASCSDCGAEWTLVSMASNLGRDVTLETGTLTTLVLKQVRAAKSKETRQRWVRQSIIAVGGLAIAAAALLMLVPARQEAPEGPPVGATVGVPGELQLAELDDAAPAELEMVLADFDAPAAMESPLDGPDLEGLDTLQMERALRSWEES